MRAEASSEEEASAAQILSQQEDGRKLMEQEEGEEQDAEKRSECGPLITEELTDGENSGHGVLSESEAAGCLSDDDGRDDLCCFTAGTVSDWREGAT